jgi:hypothetical protein
MLTGRTKERSGKPSTGLTHHLQRGDLALSESQLRSCAVGARVTEDAVKARLQLRRQLLRSGHEPIIRHNRSTATTHFACVLAGSGRTLLKIAECGLADSGIESCRLARRIRQSGESVLARKNHAYTSLQFRNRSCEVRSLA